MMDPKLPYLTMAARLRGYAEGLLEGYQGKERHGTLARTLNDAADLLQAVWDKQVEKEDATSNS